MCVFLNFYAIIDNILQNMLHLYRVSAVFVAFLVNGIAKAKKRKSCSRANINVNHRA